MKMLEYFGQSPIIVRSSSLLEDAYGNAFSGKYESVFCANQGTPQDRLENFLNAIRKVYTSTLSEEALAYRAHWGLLDRDEQMAILVQRVSGSVYEDQFFPQIAGVGVSYNPYVWNSEIDPEAGMIRLVFGLGTRAVDRIDDDYTRIVALNAPSRRPEASSEDVRKFSQKKRRHHRSGRQTASRHGLSRRSWENFPIIPLTSSPPVILPWKGAFRMPEERRSFRGCLLSMTCCPKGRS